MRQQVTALTTQLENLVQETAAQDTAKQRRFQPRLAPLLRVSQQLVTASLFPRLTDLATYTHEDFKATLHQFWKMKSRAHTAPTTERPTAASQAVPPSADPPSTEKTVVTSGHDGDDSPPKPVSIGKKSAASVNTKPARTKIVGDGVANAIDSTSKVAAVSKESATKGGRDSDSDGDSDAVADDSPPKPVSIGKKSAASANTKSAASVNTKSAASANTKSAASVNMKSAASVNTKSARTKIVGGSDSDGDSDAVADDSPPKPVSIGKKSAASANKKSARTTIVGDGVENAIDPTSKVAAVRNKSATKGGGGNKGCDSNSGGDDDSDWGEFPDPSTKQRQTLLRKRSFEEQVANSDEVHAAPTKKSKHVILSSNSSNLAGSVPDRDLPSSQTSSSLERAALSGPGLHVRMDDPARAVSEMNTSGSGASRTGAIQPATARALGKRKAQTHHDWEEDEEDEADNSFWMLNLSIQVMMISLFVVFVLTLFNLATKEW
ncbi:hypothetical protein PR001_g20306 [Phytophthora rubi]|uniref:Uncharacterized protein n=2 Tax=Phytophthora rubi TaxID=129364 RepID=A0A6A3JG07_9STRA|nr:hypothetical protein PR002_g20860 [Phytophthora rubi]KAE8994751.1 hypothetical protein PR001_g20306 [Phytophthora rubi]